MTIQDCSLPVKGMGLDEWENGSGSIALTW